MQSQEKWGISISHVADQLARLVSTGCAVEAETGVLLYLFTTSHVSLIMSFCFTQQPPCFSTLSFPSVTLLSLLSVFLYSPPPTILSFLLPSLMMPFPFILFPSCCERPARTDILITSAHIHHLIFLFHFLPFLLPHLSCFISPFPFHFCFLPFFCLSACRRLECEFPLFKVLVWAVS